MAERNLQRHLRFHQTLPRGSGHLGGWKAHMGEHTLRPLQTLIPEVFPHHPSESPASVWAVGLVTLKFRRTENCVVIGGVEQGCCLNLEIMIADSVAFALQTPAGRLFLTGTAPGSHCSGRHWPKVSLSGFLAPRKTALSCIAVFFKLWVVTH